MPETPTGCYLVPMDRLGRLVAQSAKFQEVTGAANETDALDFIAWPLADDAGADSDTALAISAPRAMVAPGEQTNTRKMGTATWAIESNLYLTFEFAVPTGGTDHTNDRNQLTWFMNRVSQILKEMQDVSGQGESVSGESHLNVVSHSLTSGFPFKLAEEETEYVGEFTGHAAPVWVAEFLIGIEG